MPRLARSRLESRGWDVHDVQDEGLASALDNTIQFERLPRNESKPHSGSWNPSGCAFETTQVAPDEGAAAPRPPATRKVESCDAMLDELALLRDVRTAEEQVAAGKGSSHAAVARKLRARLTR